MHKRTDRDLLGEIGSPGKEGLGLTGLLSASWQWDSGQTLGVVERNVGVQLTSENECAQLRLSVLFSALGGLGDKHITENQLCPDCQFKCHSLLETHSPTLTDSAVPTPWASLNPVKLTCKIDHHTLLYMFKLLYNDSPMRPWPCLNLYSNYWEYFIATAKYVEINNNTFHCANSFWVTMARWS